MAVVWVAVAMAGGGTRGEVLVQDDFSDVHGRGEVMGTTVSRGSARRLVVDPYRAMSVEPGALRMPPPATNAWGFEGISYGPFRSWPGLGLSIHVRPGGVSSWVPGVTYSLAVGWFGTVNPVQPLDSIQAIALGRSAVADRGALYLPALHPKVPFAEHVTRSDLYFTAINSGETTIWYAAGLEGMPAIAGYPAMRPLALVRSPRGQVYAGIHQRRGMAGDLPTFLESVRVAQLASPIPWSGLAVFAREYCDHAVVAPTNRVPGPRFIPGGSRTLSRIPGPVGLISVMAERGGGEGPCSVVFRGRDSLNHWRLDVYPEGLRLLRVDGGRESVPLEHLQREWPRGMNRRIWLVDDGATILVWMDELLVLSVVDITHGREGEVGYLVRMDAGIRFHHFEAHLRSTPMPAELLHAPGPDVRGTRNVAREAFDGLGETLAGRKLEPLGAWKVSGDGGAPAFGPVEGGGVAAVGDGAGDRWAVLPWLDPGSADLTAVVTLPLEGRGSPALVIGQDSDNRIEAGMNVPEGVAALLCARGGRPVRVEVGMPDLPRGVPLRMRLASDGNAVGFWIDRWPVVTAKLTDWFPELPALEMRHVGFGAVAATDGGDEGTRFTGMEFRRRPMSLAVEQGSEWRQPGLAKPVPGGRRVEVSGRGPGAGSGEPRTRPERPGSAGTTNPVVRGGAPGRVGGR